MGLGPDGKITFSHPVPPGQKLGQACGGLLLSVDPMSHYKAGVQASSRISLIGFMKHFELAFSRSWS